MRAAFFSLFFSLTAPFLALSEERCASLLERSWRGINCLYCMHENAEGGSEPINELLATSCLKRVMITYVVDGSFGYDENEIRRSIDTLTSTGQELWLQLYVYNGPAQRRWQSGVFQSFAVMNPLIFQSKMVNDKNLQAQFSYIVKTRVNPIVSYAVSRGAKVSVAPGLEDNLNDQGFKIAQKLIQKNLPRGIRVTQVRNPCFRCASGNGRALPPNTLYEEHDDLLYSRLWDGIINTDGRFFRFSSENSSLPSLYDLVSTWLVPAAARRNAFILWIPHYQDTPIGQIPRPLSQRNFRAPTADEAAEIIDFLRS